MPEPVCLMSMSKNLTPVRTSMFIYFLWVHWQWAVSDTYWDALKGLIRDVLSGKASSPTKTYGNGIRVVCTI
jgi:hypothetical protein